MNIFSHSQPTVLSMHQIGSLICNQHDNLMVKIYYYMYIIAELVVVVIRLLNVYICLLAC